MREIKFRAWDTKAKIMSYDPDAQYCYGDLNGSIELHTSLYTLMQYTGLKDKNGVEIYEGDVCQASDTTWEVTFNIFCGQYEHWCLQGQSCEVIGNIYETPELLEKTS